MPGPRCFTVALFYAVVTSSDIRSSSYVYVAPGDSIPEAVLSARKGSHAILLGSGVHRLRGSISLSGQDSGLTIRGSTDTVIDGGVVLPPFVARVDGLWEAILPFSFNSTLPTQLFVNGERRLRARAPNALGLPPWSIPSLLGDEAMFHMAGPLKACTLPSFGVCPAEDNTGFIANVSEAGFPDGWDMSGGLILVAQAWIMEWVKVANIDWKTGRVSLQGNTTNAIGQYGSSRGTPSGGRWLIENVLAALDAPGEFFVDGQNRKVLYMPVPGETPSTTVAVVPVLSTLWRASGTAVDPANNITLINVSLTNFGEATDTERLGYWAISSAAEVGPYANGITLQNVSITAGMTNGVGINDYVHDVNMDRLHIYDIGGKGVTGQGGHATSSNYSSGMRLSNSTISHVGIVYLGQPCCVSIVGDNARIIHNELFDTPYAGVVVVMDGGPSYAAAPVLEVAYNHIHDYGQGVLSDFGGVYISSRSQSQAATNWMAADIHHNLIEKAVQYEDGGYGSNGVYNDQGTGGNLFRSNVLNALGGRAINFHCGRNVTYSNNLAYNVSLQNFTASLDNGAMGGCSPDVALFGLSAKIRTNIFETVNTLNAFAPKDLFWIPPNITVQSDDNVWYGSNGQAMLFPGAVDLAAWRSQTGNDEASITADPMLRDPSHGDFSLMPESPAYALGWADIDLSSIGPIPIGQ